jgi:hypothetical protein
LLSFLILTYGVGLVKAGKRLMGFEPGGRRMGSLCLFNHPHKIIFRCPPDLR